MGIAKGAAKLLFNESLRRPFQGRVLTLGRQDIHITYETLQKTAEEFGFRLHDPGPVSLASNPELAKSGYISDECFFKSLGFNECAALDKSDFEGATYIFDLNESEVPEHLLKAFDLIVDGGTIEHVFHLPHALHNIFKMLKQGGRIIHLAPSSNHMDHGFYMFSPTLFWDFYETNKFEINTFQLIRHTTRPTIDQWEISNYQPGCLNEVSFGGLDDGMYAILCIATKTADSTGNVIPQQKIYQGIWNDSTVKTPGAEEQQPVHLRSKYQGAKDLIKKVPFLYQPLRFLNGIRHSLRQKSQSRKKGLGLKVVDRY